MRIFRPQPRRHRKGCRRLSACRSRSAATSLGRARLLGPAGEAIGTGAVSRAAAEGALAGGASGAFGSDFDPGSIAANAAGGAVLGGVAGALPKGINKALDATMSKPGTIDPDAVTASTSQAAQDAYAALHQKPVSPYAVNSALIRGRYNLSPSAETGLSPTFKAQFHDINDANNNLILNRTQPTAGDVDSWQRQINDAVTSATDKIAAGRITDNLSGVLAQHGALDAQRAAKTAFEQSKMAENSGRLDAANAGRGFDRPEAAHGGGEVLSGPARQIQNPGRHLWRQPGHARSVLDRWPLWRWPWSWDWVSHAWLAGGDDWAFGRLPGG